MNEEASNCLLKTLEEPPTSTIIILIANSLTPVKETIKSRCQIIRFHPIPAHIIEDQLVKKFNADTGKVGWISRFCSGSLGSAFELLEDNFYEKNTDIVDRISVSGIDNLFLAEEIINTYLSPRVKASHILIDTTKLKTEGELETAKQKIEEIKEEIDNGADFAETAREYSTCPSAKDGGDIGFYQKNGTLVEELAEVTFSMKVGEISEPVKTQFGYHIIKVTGKEEGKDVSYKDVADMVDIVYMQIKTEALLKGLYEKAEIEITL